MPIIKVLFDQKHVTDEEVGLLSKAVQKIVRKETGIESVFVYADSPKIILDADPIEIFVEMSASKIQDTEALFTAIKTAISTWKKEIGFTLPVNFTLIPMDWQFDVHI